MKLYILFTIVVLLASSMTAHASADTSSSRQKRVIGGRNLQQGDSPWLVSLKGRIPVKFLFGFIPIKYDTVYCGGSVLNDRWILTAAHCFDGRRQIQHPNYWKVRLASVRLGVEVSDRFINILGELFNHNPWRTWEIDVDKIIRHPLYAKNQLWLNDVALLKLEEPVPSGPSYDNIRRVELPQPGNSSFPVVGEVCLMTGWGCTSSGGQVSNTAMQVGLPVEALTVCQTHYGMPERPGSLCTGSYTSASGAGICAGDSGGPLVCQNEAGTWIQVGTASFASRIRPQQSPAVFVRTSEYVDWIKGIISNN